MSPVPPETRSREAWRNRVEGTDLVLALVICMTIVFIAGGFVGDLTAGPNSFAGNLISDGSKALAAALCFILLVLVAPTVSTPYSLGFTRFSAKFLALSVACGFLLTLLALSLSVLQVMISGNPSGGATPSSSQPPVESVVSLLLLILFGGLLVPLAEEFLLRGLLYTYLRRWGLIIAVLGSALIFSLLHPIVQFPLHLLSGVVLALLYERSGSLWPPILMHATYNTLLTVISGVAILAS